MRRAARKLAQAVLPRPVIRFGWNLVADLCALPGRLTRRKGPEPFRLFHNVGGGDYHATGERYAAMIAARTQLAPDGHVLDIGCGTGRIAQPLIRRLGAGGRYTGFDLSERAVRWARRHVEAGDAEVDFHHADLASAEYNRSGGDAASGYRFPADDASVDVAIAISLYTHLLAGDAEAYLRETARTLKPGGRAFVTAFLMTDAALANIAAGQARMPFAEIAPGVYTTDPDTPEHAIAFREALFISWAEAAGLSLEGEITRGFWSGPEREGELQDIIILRRRA